MLDDLHLTSLATLKQWLDPRPSGGISAIRVTNGGSGYTSVPTVTISDAEMGEEIGGIGAAATATVVDGVVTSVVITSPGNRYANPPVAITGGGGSGATAEADIDEDAALAKLIEDVSAMILQEAQVDVFYDSGNPITEIRDGNGRDRIVTKVRPLNGVVSVTIDGAEIPQSDGGAKGWRFDRTSISLTGFVFSGSPRNPIYVPFTGAFSSQSQSWLTRSQNVVLVYRGGEPQGSRDAVAAERACIATCALACKMRPHAHQRSESAPQGQGVSTSYLVTDFAPVTKTFIANLKRARASWHLA